MDKTKIHGQNNRIGIGHGELEVSGGITDSAHSTWTLQTGNLSITLSDL